MHACYWSLLVSGIDCFELLYYYIYYNAILSTILILKFGEHQPKFNSLFYLFITYLSTITALPDNNLIGNKLQNIAHFWTGTNVICSWDIVCGACFNVAQPNAWNWLLHFPFFKLLPKKSLYISSNLKARCNGIQANKYTHP